MGDAHNQGAVIIASPFPDEIGVSLMGMARMSGLAFVALTYVLNAAGILRTWSRGS
jgi:hypothetical protein